MTKKIRAPGKLTAPLAILGAFALQNVAAQNSGLTDADVAGIRAMTEAWLEAHANRDWDALAEQYTLDAVLMPPFAKIIEGRETIRDWFAEHENYTNVEVEIVEIGGYEDLAYVRGTTVITIARPGEDAIMFRGKYLDIRRRGADGIWRLSVDMFSPDVPIG